MRYKFLGFVTGFVAAVVLLLALRGRVGPSPTVLSECAGAIKTVEIHYTRAAAESTWEPIRAFLAQLDASVLLIVVCGDDDDDSAFQRASTDLPRRKTDIVVAHAAITGWSKDRFLVAAGTRQKLVCPKPAPSPMSSRNNDSQVAALLAKRWPDRFQVQESGLVFDAGDILCSPNSAFVNDEIPAKNPGISDWLKRVEAMTGRKAVWLRGTPGHHIGMFAAPLDERTVVVGDPDLGRRLWSPEATRKLGVPDWSDGAVGPFRKAAEELRTAGYRVVPVPTAVIGPKVYVTFTNGVFEQRDGKRIVFMPSYGVDSLDRAASKAYQSLGWEVRPIPVAGVFQLCGTIGCLVNVLERS